jgi:GNAT superfamily N-acetyltransferase
MPSPAKSITIKRTDAGDPDFTFLVAQLTFEIRELYGDFQVIYDKYNQISHLDTVVIAYVNDAAAGCGCFKEIDRKTVEIKRVYVRPAERKMGIASAIMNELEVWAKEKGYAKVITETANKLAESISFLKNRGYEMIPNYGPYVGMEASVCFRKDL